MPACVKPDRRRFAATGLRAVLAGWLGAALLTACAPAEEGGRFEVLQADAKWINGRLQGSCQLDVRLSPEAREALRHGVPLTVRLDLILRNTGDQTRVGEAAQRYEIRYLPLSEHYQVDGPGNGRAATFPRLRHAIAELSELDFVIETGALPAGDYELLARSGLDHEGMPPPMRLPALFDPGWRHASNWTSWPIGIETDG
jgi:hypothetical protein